MASFDSLIAKIRSLGEEIDFAGPQGSEAISRLEEALGVRLPPSYCAFLACYGAGGTKGSWIAGIFENSPLRSNDGYVFGETMRMRNEYGLPFGFVVIQSAAPEVAWCLDMCRLNSEQEAPVVAVDVLHGFRVDTVATDFGSFFRKYLEVRAEE